MTRFASSGPLHGSLAPPPDKSISHRAAILGAMGEGRTSVSRYLDAADTRSTLAAVEQLGAAVAITETAAGLDLEIDGVGLKGPRPAVIDVGNAGTLLRILPGWLAGTGGGEWTLDGDESIRRRPVDRVALPLRQMGAEVEPTDGRFAPLRVRGSNLRGTYYELPIASAQVKSCLLLAGLNADSPTEVIEPAPSRDHTERMLSAAGAEVVNAAHSVAIHPAPQISLGAVEVPGDFSSAAFFLAAALIVDGSEVRIDRVGVNRTRIGLLRIAQRMGGRIELAGAAETRGGEPLAALVVRHSELRGVEVNGAEVPLAIDELPLVGLLGCFAEGETIVRDAAELRHKESDRIAAVVEGLRALGADVEALPDGFAVRGGDGLRGGTIDARGDHRMAMLGAVAGLASNDGVEVSGMDAAAVSYPEFESDLAALG